MLSTNLKGFASAKLIYPDAYQHERANRLGVAHNAIILTNRSLTHSVFKL
ncbi:hypothetical protein SAMN05421863_102934 [Nitrosomonas communis]|uniref:Uncharacterized protein n=1 Tax=Nitrosomonas communis TaxID=44574 RepID=A0A1I4R049_9PROT|nr:hypothetical protein SAMN05421863_102934 [Nitrosomonas communis]